MAAPSPDPTPPRHRATGAAVGGFLTGAGAVGGVVALVAGGVLTSFSVSVYGWGEGLLDDTYGAVIGLFLQLGAIVGGLVGVLLLGLGGLALLAATGVGAGLVRGLRKRD